MSSSTVPDCEPTALAAAIQCRSLSIAYPNGVRAVDDVSLHVRSGEIVSLIGPSGCGKTTLLRLMARLSTPTAGQVAFDPPVSRKGETAFVFQQPSLMPWRTAIENVMLPLQLMAGRNSNQHRAAAEQLLTQVGLADAGDRFPRQLSGGMKMRVSLARALVTDPRVLLLDEPFAAIDDMLRHQLGQLLLELWSARRFTAVLVTHNIAEAVLLSHRVAVMRAGRIEVEFENPLAWPRTDAVRRSREFGEFYGQLSDALRGQAA
jgi:ABC-type nitrate/sulfonate/bicarbonate transport system ATPase subunit